MSSIERLRAIAEADVDDWDVLADTVHKALTLAVRQAAEDFEQSGGGSRHWVRECLWPRLRDNGLILVPHADLVELLDQLSVKEVCEC